VIKIKRIYVPNKGQGHDYTPALEHGDELVFVTAGSVNPYNTGWLFRAWAEALKESQPDDLIIMTSLTTLCCIGCAMFTAKHNRLNLLIYTREGRYKKREISYEII
jgi:hypothetical protein